MQNFSFDYNCHFRPGIMACIDSDWGSDPTSHHSQTGYFFKIVGGLFSWSLHAQKSVALSNAIKQVCLEGPGSLSLLLSIGSKPGMSDLKNSKSGLKSWTIDWIEGAVE